MEMPEITRGKLVSPLKAHQFALPDNTLVGMSGLQMFRLTGEAMDAQSGRVVH